MRMLNFGFLGAALAAVAASEASTRPFAPLELFPLPKSHGFRTRDLRRPTSKYEPHQGEREMARRRRQVAAGQIHFIEHGKRG